MIGSRLTIDIKKVYIDAFFISMRLTHAYINTRVSSKGNYNHTWLKVKFI